MFRQQEIIMGGWQEKMPEVMRKRRFEQMISRLPPLGTARLESLPQDALQRRIERSWQNIERKPMRTQQLSQVWKSVLDSIQMQADCLSHEEHELVERTLILGGSAQIRDAIELEAAQALSLRLWAHVGLVSQRPYIELEPPVIRPVARALMKPEHERIRRRFERFSGYLSETLYRLGAIDDRQPQQLILKEVLGGKREDEQLSQLARRYLWAGYDCVDYSGGVMLLHAALADPGHLLAAGRARRSILLPPQSGASFELDILPEEIPLQAELERAVDGCMREGQNASDVVRGIRYLCKQGAPLLAMKEVLQEALIVHVSPTMLGALTNMYYQTPKWIESAESSALQ